MAEPACPVIEPLAPGVFDAFLAYLGEHLSDNGGPEVGYFQPLPRGASTLPPAQAAAFRAGMSMPLGRPGWRRAWVARGPAGAIVGHVDLRGRVDAHDALRCLLGMGVHRDHRRRGLGATLVQHALHWAATRTSLQWVDLQVIAANAPARALYAQAGFKVVVERRDMFLIDGRRHAGVSMTMQLRG